MHSSLKLQPDQIFGGEFRVVRLLGEGGMGVVYVAEQLSTGRLRALKLMRSLSSGDEDARRFQQEARVGALIQSEHIVDVIAAGVEPGMGCPWLAMELLDGSDLAAYLGQRGVLPLSETAEILRQVCAGLGAAHDRRLIHRDVKPENLFLSRSATAGAGYVVKVLDFGVAKLLDTGQKNTCSIGTPAWMSPEQTQARVELTCATDVWPLGLIAFTMLTGHPYWLGAHDPGVALPALLREIVLTPLPLASERAAELHAPALPPWFDGWFAGCVNRDVAARYPTAREAWTAFAHGLGIADQGALTPSASGAGSVQHGTDSAVVFGGSRSVITAAPTQASGPWAREKAVSGNLRGAVAPPITVTPPHAAQRKNGKGFVLLAAAVLLLLGGAWYVLQRSARSLGVGAVASGASAAPPSNSNASIAPPSGRQGGRPDVAAQPSPVGEPTSSSSATATPSTSLPLPVLGDPGSASRARQSPVVTPGSQRPSPSRRPSGAGSTAVPPPAPTASDTLPALL